MQEPENIAVLWLETLEKMELIRSMVVHSLWNYSGLRQFVSGNGIFQELINRGILGVGE